MVEGRQLPGDATVGQAVLHEVDQRVDVLRGEADPLDERRLLRIREVTAASVEVDDIRQRGLAPVVEEGALQPNVAQTRRLEGAPIVPRNAPGDTLRAGAPAAPVF